MKRCAILAGCAFAIQCAAGEIVGAGGAAGKPVEPLDIASIEKTVTLAPGQKEAMMKIIAVRDKATQEFQAKNASLLKARMQAMTDALKSGDKAALAAAQKGYEEAYAGSSQIYRQAQIDLENVLTPEQRAKRQEEWASRMIKALTEPVALTPEQLAQIKAVLAKRNAGSAEPWSGGQWYESVQALLTPEQKAAIAKHRAMEYVKAVFVRAKLTDDQLRLVAAAYEGIAKNTALNSEGVMRNLADSARTLLTAEQRQAMERSGWKEISPSPAPGQLESRAAVPPK